jgi:hypothetical protein
MERKKVVVILVTVLVALLVMWAGGVQQSVPAHCEDDCTFDGLINRNCYAACARRAEADARWEKEHPAVVRPSGSPTVAAPQR